MGYVEYLHFIHSKFRSIYKSFHFSNLDLQLLPVGRSGSEASLRDLLEDAHVPDGGFCHEKA